MNHTLLSIHPGKDVTSRYTEPDVSLTSHQCLSLGSEQNNPGWIYFFFSIFIFTLLYFTMLYWFQGGSIFKKIFSCIYLAALGLRWGTSDLQLQQSEVKVLVAQSCPTPCDSMEFSRQEYWSGQPFPSPGDLPHPGIKPRSPTLQADSLLSKPLRLQ